MRRPDSETPLNDPLYVNSLIRVQTACSGLIEVKGMAPDLLFRPRNINLIYRESTVSLDPIHDLVSSAYQGRENDVSIAEIAINFKHRTPRYLVTDSAEMVKGFNIIVGVNLIDFQSEEEFERMHFGPLPGIVFDWRGTVSRKNVLCLPFDSIPRYKVYGYDLNDWRGAESKIPGDIFKIAPRLVAYGPLDSRIVGGFAEEVEFITDRLRAGKPGGPEIIIE